MPINKREKKWFASLKIGKEKEEEDQHRDTIDLLML